MKRRDFLKLTTAIVALTGCDKKVFSSEINRFGDASIFSTDITINTSQPGFATNPLLCGSNVQWVDGGDGLIQHTGTSFITPVLEKVKQLAPTVIRYPGGSQSDVYHWRAGVGSEAARTGNEHFHRKDVQIVRFGTAEFLALCESVGAAPLITVNICTGTAKEAADWVRETNITRLTSPLTGRLLPKVKTWEIGNEPYLKEDVRPETWMKPEEYARRANEFIRAMRSVDPTIRVGIPLRSDTYNGIPVTPYQGFNETVLPLLSEPFEYVSLHNAYMPFLYGNTPSNNEIYAALMGASETVRLDLEATRKQLRRLVKNRTVLMAITEYNALVTFGKQQDSYLASPAGALYVADLLRLFATQPDILMANHWSLIGNWFFGALNSSGVPRPVFDVLRMYRETLHGNYLSSNCKTKEFTTPMAGLIREARNIPVVTVTSTIESGKLRLLILNKDPQASTQTTIKLGAHKFGGDISISSLTAPDPFSSPDNANAFIRKNSQVVGKTASVTVVLPPCSLTFLESQLT